MDYLKLQNGSDVRGVALEGIPGEAVTLTPDIAREISQAFVLWLADKKGKEASSLKVGVGRDSRLSGPMLQQAVLEGLKTQGVEGIDCDMASTPAMFMSTVLKGFEFDGAIMITASHLPFNRNGLKFFTHDGGLESRDIKNILSRCGNIEAAAQPGPDTRCAALIDAYAAHLCQVISQGINMGEKPLAGFKIAVDAGNGAGGFFASKVLAPLGADVSASRYLDPDGSFPNHIPNPENKEAMESIRQAVLEGKCDLGVIFDTDVDRAGAVLDDGEELSRNRLIGLMAAIVAQEAPHSVVVTDSVTSAELKDFIEGSLGCVHHRFKRGYKNVINEAIRLNEEGKECLLAMETSGHGALKENYFLDDGAYLSAKIIIQMARLRKEGKSLGQMLSALREPLEAKEYRPRLTTQDFKTTGLAVLSALEKYAKGQQGWIAATDNHEGLRFTIPAQQGWFLLRLSLHDPLMPLNIESNKAGGADAIRLEVLEFLNTCEGLDLTPVK